MLLYTLDPLLSHNEHRSLCTVEWTGTRLVCSKGNFPVQAAKYLITSSDQSCKAADIAIITCKAMRSLQNISEHSYVTTIVNH